MWPPLNDSIFYKTVESSYDNPIFEDYLEFDFQLNLDNKKYKWDTQVTECFSHIEFLILKEQLVKSISSHVPNIF